MREAANLEYKRELSKSYLKTVSAFANYGTGRIVFGVDDEGSPIGLDDPKDACLRIENAVNDGLIPVPRFELAINDATNTVVLTVFEGSSKPYLYGGKAYRRADSSTVEVGRLEYNRLALIGANSSFDSAESGTQDLTFGGLEAELVEKVGLTGLDENALISLELKTRTGAFNNAAALLADENVFAGIDMARFGKSISTILSRHSFARISVLEQLKRALAVFDEHYVYEEVVGAQRVEKSLVPREAFREAVANALVHRCWDVRANVQIALYEDRIEVTSPGGLPEGITKEEYAAGGLSVVRNPILANVFFRLGYIERFGTGIPRIMEEYTPFDASPRFEVRESSIVVVLPVVGAVRLGAAERLVLNALPKGSALTRSQLAEATGMSKDKTVRLLNSLIDKGLVERLGSARSTRYTRG